MAKKASDLGRCSQRLCQEKATVACQFELRGRKAGEVCGRPLCADHRQRAVGKLVCHPHMRWMATAKTLNEAMPAVAAFLAAGTMPLTYAKFIGGPQDFGPEGLKR